jgi:hypothetical protein
MRLPPPKSQPAGEIAEKTQKNTMCELRSVREQVFGDFASKLLLHLNSLRVPRLRGE